MDERHQVPGAGEVAVKSEQRRERVMQKRALATSGLEVSALGTAYLPVFALWAVTVVVMLHRCSPSPDPQAHR